MTSVAPPETELNARTWTPLRPRARVRLAFEIAWVYPQVRWWLRQNTLPEAVHRARDREPVRALRSVAPLVAAVRLGYSVGRMAEVLPGDTRCLVRSMLLITLLARRGIEGTLVIGVRPGQEFAAHAWVELDGVTLLPTSHEEFGRLYEL
jgi:hypothetical protein